MRVAKRIVGEHARFVLEHDDGAGRRCGRFRPSAWISKVVRVAWAKSGECDAASGTAQSGFEQ
jgi:hypothetical protein